MANPAETLRVSTDLSACARRLARGASLELNSLELTEFDAAREFLHRDQRIYVSHLPRQGWAQTFDICARVAAAGFEPIPHIPVRLVADAAQLAAILRSARDVGVREPLLLAGDYPDAQGTFENVLEVLRLDTLCALGFTRVSLAGHPEGHPQVPARVIRQAQIDKWHVCVERRLKVTFVTQFFFAAAPFTQWACDLRAAGVDARLVAGLAGPTSFGKLLRLARRCGVGPSLRALTSRPAAMFGLMADHAPDALIHDLAIEWQRFTGLFDGVHLFSLGGFRRTAAWLRQQAS